MFVQTALCGLRASSMRFEVAQCFAAPKYFKRIGGRRIERPSFKNFHRKINLEKFCPAK
jgi:hypothetical protein